MSWALTEQSEGLTVTTRYSEDVEHIFVDYSEALENKSYLMEIYEEVAVSSLPKEIKRQISDELERMATDIFEFDLLITHEALHCKNPSKFLQSSKEK